MRSSVLRLLGAAAVFVASLVPLTTHAAENVLSPNLLNDPSFEEGMYHVSMSNFIANGWSYWYQGRAPNDPRGNWMPEPEFGIISDRPGQAHSGSKSQRWFNTWAIHNAGVYQRVSVPANSWVRFSIWMFNWSSQNDDFGVSDGFHHKWVGIDPTGGTDPFSPNIVWGNEDRTMDVWVQLGAIAQAKGDAVTVFVREMPEYAIKHNDVLIDDAELVTIPPVLGPVFQPVAQGTRPVRANIDKPENAVEVSRVATTSTLQGETSTRYQYFKFSYPGGDANYKINILAQPDDSGLLAKFGFRVYGPVQGKVYTQSGFQRSLVPNVTADMPAAEPGTYMIQVFNASSGPPVDFKIWLTGKNLIGEVPTAASPTLVPPTATPIPPPPTATPIPPPLAPGEPDPNATPGP